MLDRVEIPLSSMSELDSVLKAIVIEFEDARRHGAQLVDAIGRPAGNGALAEAADDFEGRWDDKRETLKQRLVELQSRVVETRSAWAELDVELGRAVESAEA